MTNSDYRFNIKYENELEDNFESGYHINETELKFDMKYILNNEHQFNYSISSKFYNVEPREIMPKGESSNILPVSLKNERALESALFISDDFKLMIGLN